VSDLRAFYRQAVRILQPGGLFLVTEYHPFRGIFEDDPERLEVETSYLERGPFRYQVSEDLFDPTPGEFPAYEYHWTIADFYNAITEPGCVLIALDEVGDEPEGWEVPPLHGLPHIILLAARKHST
jgi:SAM-dependent methyltransferase